MFSISLRRKDLGIPAPEAFLRPRRRPFRKKSKKARAARSAKEDATGRQRKTTESGRFQPSVLFQMAQRGCLPAINQDIFRKSAAAAGGLPDSPRIA
jgi:hypothetical protein